MEKRRHTALILALVICLGAVAATPATDNRQPTTDYSKGILDRQQAIKAAAEVTSQAYPNADLVQVDDFTICEYRADGTGMMWSDNYTKVLTEKGRRPLQELSFGFLLPNNTRAVKRLG